MSALQTVALVSLLQRVDADPVYIEIAVDHGMTVRWALDPAAWVLETGKGSAAILSALTMAKMDMVLSGKAPTDLKVYVRELLCDSIHSLSHGPKPDITGCATILDVPVVPALRNATAVGQLVRGSSPTSRYVCVLLTPSVHLAARIKGTMLSVRAEPTTSGGFGPALDTKLASLGLTVHDGGYASGHFDGTTFEHSCMAVSAICAGLALFVSGSPEVLSITALKELPGQGV